MITSLLLLIFIGISFGVFCGYGIHKYIYAEPRNTIGRFAIAWGGVIILTILMPNGLWHIRELVGLNGNPINIGNLLLVACFLGSWGFTYKLRGAR